MNHSFCLPLTIGLMPRQVLDFHCKLETRQPVVPNLLNTGVLSFSQQFKATFLIELAPMLFPELIDMILRVLQFHVLIPSRLWQIVAISDIIAECSGVVIWFFSMHCSLRYRNRTNISDAVEDGVPVYCILPQGKNRIM